MLARLPRLLLALALASSVGLHWAFFQTIAWAGMVITYSHRAPLIEAVGQTFDGQHPCKLCKQIADGKRSEKKSEYKIEMAKLKFPFGHAKYLRDTPALLWEIFPKNENAGLLLAPPPVPPPRSRLG